MKENNHERKTEKSNQGVQRFGNPFVQNDSFPAKSIQITEGNYC